MNIDLYRTLLSRYEYFSKDIQYNTGGDIKPKIFIYSKNEPLKIGVIPDNINYLIINSDQELLEGSIPNNVMYIYFGKKYNKPFRKGILHNNIKKVFFGNLSLFNQELYPGDIPNSVTHLKFGLKFNKPLCKGIIPEGVLYLVFGLGFNQPLKPGDIPNGVISLKFNMNFNQVIKKGDLPDSVMFIQFGLLFNYPLDDNNIPKNLIEIILDNTYDSTLLNINKKIMIGTKTLLTIKYSDYMDIKMDVIDHSIFLKNIYHFNEKLIGKIIYNELIHLILNPLYIKYIKDKY